MAAVPLIAQLGLRARPFPAGYTAAAGDVEFDPVSGRLLSYTNLLGSVQSNYMDGASNKQFHGFPLDANGARLVTVAYNATTRRWTLTALSGSTFNIWVNGRVLQVASPYTSDQHNTSEGEYFFKVNSSGNFVVGTAVWDLRTEVPISYCYYNDDGVNNPLGIGFYELHDYLRDPQLHAQQHLITGAQIIGPAALTGSYTVATGPANNAANQWGVQSTTLRDEDISLSIAALAAGGPYTVLYRVGVGGPWRWDTTPTLPYLYDVGSDQPYYNMNTAGTWSLELITVTDRYYNVWVARTTAVTGTFQTFLVLGQNVYTSLASAQAETYASIDWGNLTFQEIAPLYKITMRFNTGYTGANGRVRIESIERLVGFRASFTAAASPGAHNTLSGRNLSGCHPIEAVGDNPSLATRIAFVDSLLGGLTSSASLTWNDTNKTLNINQGTLTSPEEGLLLEATWNSGVTAFTAVKVDVVNTSSLAGSRLLDLLVGGVSQFNVDRVGNVSIAGKLTVAGLLDPTGLALTEVSSNPGGALSDQTIWVDDSEGDLWFGSLNITGNGVLPEADNNGDMLIWGGSDWEATDSLHWSETLGFEVDGDIRTSYYLYAENVYAGSDLEAGGYIYAGSGFRGDPNSGYGVTDIDFVTFAQTSSSPGSYSLWVDDSEGDLWFEYTNIITGLLPPGSSNGNMLYWDSSQWLEGDYFNVDPFNSRAQILASGGLLVNTTDGVSITQGSIASSKFALNMSATWSNAAVTFTCVKLNITDTESAAGSLLMDLQVGGVSQFSVNKAGNVNIAGKLTVTGLIDPIGLVLDAQATVPGGVPGADKGTIWIKDGSPTTVWFTNSAGTDIELGVGGGGAPGGLNGQLQYNKNGVFGGVNALYSSGTPGLLNLISELWVQNDILFTVGHTFYNYKSTQQLINGSIGAWKVMDVRVISQSGGGHHRSELTRSTSDPVHEKISNYPVVGGDGQVIRSSIAVPANGIVLEISLAGWNMILAARITCCLFKYATDGALDYDNVVSFELLTVLKGYTPEDEYYGFAIPYVILGQTGDLSAFTINVIAGPNSAYPNEFSTSTGQDMRVLQLDIAGPAGWYASAYGQPLAGPMGALYSVYKAAGSFEIYPPFGCNRVEVIMCAGGGGGGASATDGSTYTATGGGGGSGYYAVVSGLVIDINSSHSIGITIGSGGAGAVAGVDSAGAIGESTTVEYVGGSGWTNTVIGGEGGTSGTSGGAGTGGSGYVPGDNGAYDGSSTPLSGGDGGYFEQVSAEGRYPSIVNYGGDGADCDGTTPEDGDDGTDGFVVLRFYKE